MHRFSFAVLVAVAVSIGSGEAHADPGALGVAGNYNGFFFDTTASDQVKSSNSQGALAFGGNTTYQFTNINGSSLPADGNALVVGGNLLVPGNGDTISQGNVAIGGTYTTDPVQPSWAGLTVSNGSITSNLGSGIPVNFASAATYLQNLSAAQVGVDQSPTPSGSSLIFAGSGTSTPTTSFYDITTAQFSSASLQITGSATDTVVINVLGSGSASFTGGVTLSGGITANHVLFNFPSVTALNFSHWTINGSVLATKASITTDGGTINGTLIGKSLNGTGTNFNSSPFDGNLRPVAVPEPSSVALLGLGGIGFLGVLRRRRDAR